MTKKQAKSTLQRLLKEHCTCGCEDLPRCQHKAGCPYRIVIIRQPEPVKLLAGPLYAIA